MAGNMYNPEHISLEGFKVVQGSTFNSRFTSRGISVACYPKKFRFSKECILALGNCEHVVMMQNNETRQLLVRAANSSEENSFRWRSASNRDSLEKQNLELMEGIFTRMGWNTDMKYIVVGRIALAGNYPVLLFDLSVSTPEEYKKTKPDADGTNLQQKPAATTAV